MINDHIDLHRLHFHRATHGDNTLFVMLYDLHSFEKV